MLDDFPAREDFPSFGEISIGSWARPKQILSALRREPTASNRVSLSKALDRLCHRGCVAKAMGGLYSAGKFYRYVRIAAARGDPQQDSSI